MSEAELARLRGEIDASDRELTALLRRRLALVQQVGEVKKAQGLPVWVPEREASMLAARREEAAAQGLSPALIEDVLRRVMRESYTREAAAGVAARRVVVVGGAGRLGRRFAQAFATSGHTVAVLERGDWPRAPELVRDADLVLVSVPVALTAGVIAALPPLPEGCVLADLTSLKTGPVAAMLAAHPGPVLGLHPMFGPDVSSFAKEVVAVCEARPGGGWVLEQLAMWGLQLEPCTPEEHDGLMGLIQAMRHASTVAYGLSLSREGVAPARLLALSSPIYRLELAMVGRLFAQDPGLYHDIIAAHDPGPLRRYRETLGELLTLLEGPDSAAAFAECFAEVRGFFGDLGEQFLQESRDLLAGSKDRRRPG